MPLLNETVLPAFADRANLFTAPQTGAFQDRGAAHHDTAAYEEGSSTGGLDEATAAAAADDGTSTGIRLSPRTYSIGTNHTFGTAGVPITVAPGAMLRPPAGVTYTVNGAVSAGAFQWIDLSLGGTVKWAFGQEIQARWFGAKGDGVTDDTAAIQAAMSSNRGYELPSNGSASLPVQLGAGIFMIRQIIIPQNTRLQGVGRGQGEFHGTTLRQIEGSNVDMIRFDATVGSGGIRYLAHVAVQNLKLWGAVDTGGAYTHGMHICQPDGSPCTPSDTCDFDDIQVEQFLGDGVRFSNGLVPGILRNIRPFENIGAGIRIIRIPGSSPTSQSIALESISGDANADGLVCIEGMQGTDAQQTTITIYDFKSEDRKLGAATFGQPGWVHPQWGDSSNGWQKDAIVLRECSEMTVLVIGGNHLVGGGLGRDSRSAVYVTNAASASPLSYFYGQAATTRRPVVKILGTRITYRGSSGYGWDGTPGGETVLGYDDVSSPTIYTRSRKKHSGSFGLVTEEAETGFGRGTNTVMSRMLGVDVMEWQGATGSGNPRVQWAGSQPEHHFYETDAPANKHQWINRANGGKLELGVPVPDSGVPGPPAISISLSSLGAVSSVDIPMINLSPPNARQLVVTASSDTIDVTNYDTILLHTATAGADIEIGGLVGGAAGKRVKVIKDNTGFRGIVRTQKAGVAAGTEIRGVGQRDHVIGNLGALEVEYDPWTPAWHVVSATDPRRVITVSDGSTSIDVSGIRTLILANTSPTSIAALTGAGPDHLLTVLCTTANNTLVHGTSTSTYAMRLSGGANLTPAANGTLLMQYFYSSTTSGIWRQVTAVVTT